MHTPVPPPLPTKKTSKSISGLSFHSYEEKEDQFGA